MDIEKLKAIQQGFIDEARKAKPKSKNYKPYGYNNMEIFKQTDEYKLYLEEYYQDNQD